MVPEQRTNAHFTRTQWTLVLSAKSEDTHADEALCELCRKYWYPLYAFVRRSGRSPHQAEDLIQGFFAHLLQRQWLHGVGREKGRFRAFLLACLNNYLSNEWKKDHGAMRWPSGGVVPLEIGDGETQYSHEPADEETPEKTFHRRWASTLVDQIKARLRSECQREGKGALFEKLEPHLAGRAEHGTYAELASILGMNEGAIRVAQHRLRKRFGEMLRETVAETLADPADVDDEIRHLFSAWG